LPLSPSVKKLEKEINDELKGLGLKSIRIDGFDSKERALEYCNPYNGNVKNECKDKFNKVQEVVLKHYNDWIKKNP